MPYQYPNYMPKKPRYFKFKLALVGIGATALTSVCVVGAAHYQQTIDAVLAAQAKCAEEKLGPDSSVEMFGVNEFFINRAQQGLRTIVGGKIVLRKGGKDTFNLAVGPYDPYDTTGTRLVTQLQPCRADLVRVTMAVPAQG